MPFNPGPFDLETTRLVLAPDGSATPKAVTANFYQELAGEFEPFAGHLLVAQHQFDQAWPTWEIHPKGDELVYLLSGDVDVVLWTEDGEQTVRVNQPGSYIVVPKNTWHTARPRQPSSMLFVTPGEGTQNAETPTL